MKFKTLGKNSTTLNYLKSYFKSLLETNIRMAYFTPKKAIPYSSRLQNGENFLLQNELLYPYTIYLDTKEELNSPLFVSLNLEKLLIFADENLLFTQGKSAIIINKRFENLYHNIENNVKYLNKIIEFDREKKIDLPVSVYSRILFSNTAYSKIKFFKDDNVLLNEENYNKVLDLYMKKIEYCDSSSLSQVIYSLANRVNFDNSNLWKMLYENLKRVKFDCEFTKVKNCSPHIFKYVELKNRLDEQNYWEYLIVLTLENLTARNIDGAKEMHESIKQRFYINTKL